MTQTLFTTLLLRAKQHQINETSRADVDVFHECNITKNIVRKTFIAFDRRRGEIKTIVHVYLQLHGITLQQYKNNDDS